MGETTDALADAARRAFRAPFGAVLKLAPDEGAALWIDGRRSPPAVLAGAPKDAEAVCMISGARDALIRVMSGARAFESAYVAGRIAVSGDMSVMARLKLEAAR